MGEVNTLLIDRKTEPGIFLVDEEENAILLPNRYVTDKMQIGELIEVFVYKDSEDRDIATTLHPLVKLNEFALLRVVDANEYGAFLDWGLPKDLFVPRNFQKTKFRIGEERIIYLLIDERTGRLVGREKISKFLSNKNSDFKINDKVKIFILDKTPLGFKVIINNNYEGMLFHNEIFEELKKGDKKEAFIKRVRDDGKIDLTLQPIKSNISFFEKKILSVLEENDGKSFFTYKSDATEIKRVFGISKKNFKKTLTMMKEKNSIIIYEHYIKLL